MPQSLVQIYVHLVFSTKNRNPFLTDVTLRDKLHRWLAGTCNNLEYPALIVGGVEDHVHLLLRMNARWALADLIRELKKSSSKWIKEQDSSLGDFYWQNGYGAFSVSPTDVERVRKYIANQEEHHRHESFQDEFRRLCSEYGVLLDERYAWD